MEIFDVRKPIPTNYGEHVQQFAALWGRQIDLIRQKFGEVIEEVRQQPEYPTDVPILYVKKDSLIAVMEYLKTDSEQMYDFLSDITATDEGGDFRFEVVYQLYSMPRKNRIRVKCRVREGEEVPTLIPVWTGANWAEREIWDMFGIRFQGHPDLRRILMDERWVGHPLRKDYPLRGYQVFTSPMPVNTRLLED